MMMGLEQPDAGAVDFGDSVEIGYVDQRHKRLTPRRPFGRWFLVGMSSWISAAVW